ncbi:MAG: sigma-70 family RNA polymerase sigma factor [Clostridiales bacterium]|nr:sigma-70 family RNA polymerase sigma factor [Clostridiales bacterium]
MNSAAHERDFKREAWLTQLMEDHGTQILRLCFTYLKDTGLAEDAAQDTFLKAYRAFGRGVKPDSERAWLARIAINTCKDVLRSAWFRHRARNLPLEEAMLTSSHSLDPDELDLVEDVMRLKPAFRVVILLHFYQGYSAEEIAGILNISVSTVYYRLKRAQDKLRAQLTKEAQHASR